MNRICYKKLSLRCSRGLARAVEKALDKTSHLGSGPEKSGAMMHNGAGSHCTYSSCARSQSGRCIWVTIQEIMDINQCLDAEKNDLVGEPGEEWQIARN